jgi:hypothetical protein
MGITRPALILSIIFALFAVGTKVHADGKYFSRLSIDRDPTIPSQRAIIVWRAGVQTLIIESVVDSEGEELGWILPLPSVPEAIEACTPGTVRSMAELITPKIHGRRSASRWMAAGSLVFLAGLLIFLVIVCIRSSLLTATAIVGLIFLLLGLFLPALGKARGFAPIPGVDVVAVNRIGNFDVTVIRAESGARAVQWLEHNGFSHDPRSIEVLNSYANENWCFAVARIRNDVDRPVSPHPVRVTFSATEAVYPMRLTGVTDAPLLLDLFVISDERAAAVGFATWNSDTYRQNHTHFNAAGDPVATYQGERHGQRIGHPQIMSLMWDGCVVSHLRGHLKPAQMKRDIVFNWQPPSSVRREIHSSSAARARAVGLALLLLGAGLPMLAFLHRSGGFFNRTTARSTAAVVSIALCSGIVTYIATDIQPVSEHRDRRRMIWPHSMYHNFRDADKQPSMTIEQIRSELLAYPPRWESHADMDSWHLDVPHGFTLTEEASSTLRLTIYDRTASPASISLPVARQQE